MKWNESGFRPLLCTYRLNWARRTSWGWWDDWDDTVLQTQNSKFEPWRSEAEHATSRSRRLPTILTFTRGWGRNIFVSFKPPRPGTEPRTLAWKAAVLTTTLGPPPSKDANCVIALQGLNTLLTLSRNIIILVIIKQRISTIIIPAAIRVMLREYVRIRGRPANTMCWSNADLILGQRRRRWANIVSTPCLSREWSDLET